MSATISPDAVAKLRSQTGAGMMDCKRALATANGDMDKALQLLREQGAASAAKKAGRTTGDGLVTAYVDPAGKTAVLLELNCETDFVARTDDFKNLVVDLAKQAGTASPAWKSPADAPQKPVQDAVAKLGENMALRRFERYDQSGGVFGVYIHPSGGTGKVGVLIEVSGGAGEDAKTLAKDLAMQIAATSPRWVAKEEVPADVLENEKKIARELAKKEGKPEKIWDKIADGKAQQFYGQFVLLEQPFVKDPGGKTKVSAVVAEASKKSGGTLAPKRFVRYKVAEEV